MTDVKVIFIKGKWVAGPFPCWLWKRKPLKNLKLQSQITNSALGSSLGKFQYSWSSEIGILHLWNFRKHLVSVLVVTQLLLCILL